MNLEIMQQEISVPNQFSVHIIAIGAKVLNGI